METVRTWRLRGSRHTPLVVIWLVAGILALSSLSPAEAASSAVKTGRAAFLAGRYHVAITAFSSHLNTSMRDADAWTWLGASYYELSHDAQAAAAFEQALRLKDRDSVRLWLGATYARLGRHSDARRELRSVARSMDKRTARLAVHWLRSLEGQRIPVLTATMRPQDYAHVVRWYNPRLTNAQVDAIVRSVLYYSTIYRVDPRLVMSLIAIESGFQITAQSRAGAYGLGQLMPATWQALNVHPGDPVANIYGTVRVLRGQMDRFGQNPSLALAAYNAGRGAVERHGGIPPYRETQWYVFNVLSLYRHLTGS